ncbi:HD domain-containing protein [Mycobacterium lehmannii]|uniref:HD domain-containing protein n=1 Tax=Mycobacterium lehmannii TaxID=2048550 RepID=UPI0009EB85B9|nr:HD domain-containing protein [Mycobacterium lehmannii]
MRTEDMATLADAKADVDSWALPDTEICSEALRYVIDVSPDFLINHCVRSYLFAREIASGQGMRSGTDYDDELVFLACLLHDLGVTDAGRGDQRFEVEGADAAADFLRRQGLSADRITTVWQAIALHTSAGLANRFGPDQSVVFNGIALDINGMDKHLLSPGFADRVHAAWPRHDLGYAIADAVARDVRLNPMKAPPFSFPAHLHELINGSTFSFFDFVRASGWGDQPLRGDSSAP